MFKVGNQYLILIVKIEKFVIVSLLKFSSPLNFDSFYFLIFQQFIFRILFERLKIIPLSETVLNLVEFKIAKKK